MTDRVCRRLRIHGRVQGVWFRESMRQEAEQCQVRGWVRNRMDGTVEAAVEGTPEAVEAMIRWARRGPEAAQVQRVEVGPDEGGYPDFRKRPTG